MKLKFLAILFTLLLTSMAQATEMIQFGETVRSYGMGGVRVPMEGHDAGAFLWNPAVLTYVKGMNWEIFNLNLGVNGTQVYNDFKDIDLSSGALNALSPYFGKHVWLGGQGYSAFTLPFFGVAVYDQTLLEFQLNNPVYPTLDVNYLNDYAFAIAGSVPLGPQGSFGITAKRIDRLGGPQQLGPSVLNTINSQQGVLDQFTNEGVGYGMDAGLMYRVPAPMNPTFSLAWQDIGSTAFVKTKGTSQPDRIKDNLTFSTTFEQETLLGGLAGGIEYRHITDADEQLGKKIHAGLELSLLLADVRAGFYQGYTTYGVGVNLWLIKLDAAMYTVERGAYPGQTPETRDQISLSMNFSFDPDFNLTDTNGKPRRLKQRR